MVRGLSFITLAAQNARRRSRRAALFVEPLKRTIQTDAERRREVPFVALFIFGTFFSFARSRAARETARERTRRSDKTAEERASEERESKQFEQMQFACELTIYDDYFIDIRRTTRAPSAALSICIKVSSVDNQNVPLIFHISRMTIFVSLFSPFPLLCRRPRRPPLA